ncbi:PREDICTED: dnaJ homolog subfamily C member 9-like [Branchiostoma belcheri]|uniref:DnaJ homolog subfamily C member 9 n=1 Tax=Branchiostoma belcheri TaxID=7741 RepID=A0A6P5A5B7_BRABE|nr:PREDICTED: dnaJ homolog subfamily C member 9-like [Branchiostoma belcheri]
MPGLLQTCEDLFSTRDLYKVIGVERTATEKQVKKGYYRMSMRFHPDRNSDDAQSTEKFQALSKVYSVLSDTGKRALYDESGEVDDEVDVDEDKDWASYWRLLFPQVTLQAVKDFEKNYKGSEEELADLKSAYLEHEGDMDDIMDAVTLATLEDEPRFRKLLIGQIRSGDLPNFPAFSQEDRSKQQRRKCKAKKEAKEAESAMKELGMDGSEDVLQKMIAQRSQNRESQFNNFMADLEARYAPKGKKTKKGKK